MRAEKREKLSMRRQRSDPGEVHKRIGDFTYVPNSYVNDNGNRNLSNSNVENDDNVVVVVRFKRITYVTLLRQPPIWRRASVSLAWIFSTFVSFASLSSKIARSFRAVISAEASALMR